MKSSLVGLEHGFEANRIDVSRLLNEEVAGWTVAAQQSPIYLIPAGLTSAAPAMLCEP
jgi:hypothetical protein